jgi:acyl-coenzyme A thioesterase PaaI-like protein
VHGGAITATLDNACGWCIGAHPEYENRTSMATQDLRVDFIRPAVPELDIMVVAEY